MPKQIGYAVIGAGELARAALPAFNAASENSRLVAVVAGDRAEAQGLAQEHRAAAYHFDEFRQCLNRDDVQAVYIALPPACIPITRSTPRAPACTSSASGRWR